MDPYFDDLFPIGSKEAKRSIANHAVFRTYCRGACSNSDAYVYGFNRDDLVTRAEAMVENYNAELARWLKKGRPKKLDAFLNVDEAILKWVRHTKKTLLRGQELHFDPSKIRVGLYRPFCKMHYYFEGAFNEDLYQLPAIFPNEKAEHENRAICVSQTQERPFAALVTDKIPNLVMARWIRILHPMFPFLHL